MWKVFFQTGRQTQQFFFVTSRIQRHNIGKLRRSRCERPCLVKHYRINFSERFKIASALDKGAVSCSGLHAGQNRQRRCQTQCAGIVHHQDAGRAREISGKEKHKAGERKVIGNDGIGQTFSLPLNTRLAFLAGFNKFDDF